MNSEKFISTYYLLSKKKIETVPKSLESYKDSIYFLGETKKDRAKFVFDCVDDFQNIYFYLEKIGFEFCGAASIENMNESLVSEFILKETFDAIFYIENELDSKSISFINSLAANISYVQEDLEKSNGWLDEMESYVEANANVEIHSYFENLVDEVNKLQQKTNEFKKISLNYLKPNIIKYIKID
jgi:hypothetical protein